MSVLFGSKTSILINGDLVTGAVYSDKMSQRSKYNSHRFIWEIYENDMSRAMLIISNHQSYFIGLLKMTFFSINRKVTSKNTKKSDPLNRKQIRTSKHFKRLYFKKL